MPSLTIPRRFQVQPLPAPRQGAAKRGGRSQRPAKRRPLTLPKLPRRPSPSSSEPVELAADDLEFIEEPRPRPLACLDMPRRSSPAAPSTHSRPRLPQVQLYRPDPQATSGSVDALANTVHSRGPVDPANLHGTLCDRYKIVRRIDAGGQGIVYEAYDRIERRPVALKVWLGLDGDDDDTFRLKREFRAAADVRHPNLARLYNLVDDRELGLAFFTMELVRGGVDFVTHVRRTARPGDCRADLERLRRATRQLAEGIAALHEFGHIHRDLKPSNVLVCDDDRVVILDFGLAAVRRSDAVTLRTTALEGTPHFMAPEQLGRDALVTPAIDCYALGVILYEALTGTMPLDADTLAELLAAKHCAEPKPPSSRVTGIPADLDALVLRLLDKDPDQRATITDVLAWCDTNTQGLMAPNAPRRMTRPRLHTAALLGRRKPLRRLKEALDRAQEGQTPFMLVSGPSGTGKSALLHHFVDALRSSRPTAVILTGRCIERESVPYRAFDSLIEELARFLVGCSEGERARLLANGLEHLPQIFPVLARVPGLADDVTTEARGDQRSRLAAFAELRGLLTRIGEERPLILYIDDLHLGDLDSAALLDALLAAPEAPAMLVLASARSGAAERSPLLQSLDAKPEVVELEPLSPREATSFARTCLGDLIDANSRFAAELARACNGNASLIEQLAAALRWHPQTIAQHSSGDAPLTLERLLEPLLGDLDDLARELLELLAVEDAPVALELLDIASGRKSRFREALSELREVALICVEENDEHPEAAIVECPQRSVREAFDRLLGRSRRDQHHRALARAHQHSGFGDDERCAHHLLAADDREGAMHHAANAAFIAQRALAFDHAVKLYQLALRCDPHSRELRLKLADVLAAAGRFESAAIQRLRAAFSVTGRRRIELAATACEHFFLAGRDGRGRRTAAAILDQLGVDFPETDTRARHLFRQELASLAAHPLEFREQSRCQIGGDLLLKIDVCVNLGRLLHSSDPLRAGYLAARGAQLALMAGEPRRVAQGLALVGVLAAADDSALADRLIERADAIASHIRDPYAIGLASLCRGRLSLREGHFFEALAAFAHGQDTLRERGVEGRWERTTALLGRLAANAALGELDQLRATIAAAEADTDLADDPCVRPWLTLYHGILSLADDDSDLAEVRLCKAVRALADDNRRLAHAHGTRLAVLCDLYRGLPHKAQSRLWGPRGRGLVAAASDDDVRLHRGFWELLQGKVALARALQRREAEADLVMIVERAIEVLDGAEAPALRAEAALLRSGLASLCGDAELTLRILGEADALLLTAGMDTARLCVQLRQAEVVGDPRATAKAIEAIERAGCVAGERWAATVLPPLTGCAPAPTLAAA